MTGSSSSMNDPDDKPYIPILVQPSAEEMTQDPRGVNYIQLHATEHRLWVWVKEQPLIPLGITSSIGILIFGIRSSLKEKHIVNNWRYQSARIVAQIFTVSAMVYYGWFGIRERPRIKQRIP